MAISTTDGVGVAGGQAQPVYIVNSQVPTSGGGSGGSGDASAANQVTGNDSLATIATQTARPTALTSGTQSATTSAGALNSGTSLTCIGLLVTNDPASAVNVLIGNSAAQSYPLEPGDSAAIAIDNVNKVYVKTASGTATVNWIRTG